MQLNSLQKKRIRRISLTPLIDVVFLLLIFFMLSSTFLKFVKIPIDGTRASSTGPLEKKDLVIIKILGTDDIEIDDKPVDKANFINKLNELNASGKSKAILKVEDKVIVQDVIGILEDAKKSSLENILLVQ